MRYFEHAASDIDTMLKVLNKRSVDELFASVPESMRLKRKLALPEALDELSLKRMLKPFTAAQEQLCFIGAGATEHFVPEWISQQLLRAEWYTSYTPYQPELAQGTLQALFEFQSIVTRLFGLEVANASLYDGATALVEALLLAVRVKQKKRVIVGRNIHPEYLQTLHCYLGLAEIMVIEAPFTKDGTIDKDELSRLILEHERDLAAIAIASPNFFGLIEDVSLLAKIAHQHQAFLIGVQTDMSSCGVLNSFGYLGADIAVGEGLGLLPGLNLGGPGVGLFATHQTLVRQLPGRLVGYSEDAHKNGGYVLTLSAREQHIRREKATSNICTNHNLMALAFAMCMAAYGASGLKKLGLMNLKKTRYFRQCLQEYGVKVAFLAPHYNETVLSFAREEELLSKISEARHHKIEAGLKLSAFFPELQGHLLISTTELHEDKSIKQLASILGGHHG